MCGYMRVRMARRVFSEDLWLRVRIFGSYERVEVLAQNKRDGSSHSRVWCLDANHDMTVGQNSIEVKAQHNSGDVDHQM